MPLDLRELVDPAHTALVLQEVQNGVVGERSVLPQLAAAARDVDLVAHCAALAPRARELDVPVFHRTAALQDGTPFVIQGGDPTGTGTGGPGYTIKDEPVTTAYHRGTVAMARTSEPDSVGSQFFIVVADACTWLDGLHTVFGRVSSGMDVVDEIAKLPTDGQDRPFDEVRIESVALAG